MSDPVLSVENLSTHFFTRAGVVKAVDGVSFDLARGEIMGLVGESGSGKTVTGFSLLGLVDAPGSIVEGSIRLNGTELTTLSQKELRRRRGRDISMIFQDPIATLNPMLTIGQQMKLAIDAHESLSRSAAEARAADLLTQVGIPSAQARLRAYPHEFSGGMRQRVAIAIALLHRPAVIVADEPTTALDVSIQAQILFQMRDLAAETGTAMIWISHDLAVVSSLASKLAVMYAGRIVEQGPTATLLRDPRHPYTAGLIASLPATAKPGMPLTQIPGTTPSLLSLPPGCPFAPRCDRATEQCATTPQMTLQENRGWRCFHPVGQNIEVSA
ncbi:ABC transporter ATP-binding protein [Hoeflea ulvae]|uniref:ABC transporter ATP-binding protein n=1 Tax=Hoeflea ulvae TaxID=2983764 RepID=A0ABT3YLJ6_9HYPH|nr:ABC transporter ATP-binding protein [Hoeflea ulvae]MCY0096784.1 ABC transporter ATP-binding protein [Hoeflea ulvae]